VWGIYEGVPGEGGAPNQYTGEASAMGTGKNIHEPKAEGRIFAGRIRVVSLGEDGLPEL